MMQTLFYRSTTLVIWKNDRIDRPDGAWSWPDSPKGEGVFWQGGLDQRGQPDALRN